MKSLLFSLFAFCSLSACQNETPDRIQREGKPDIELVFSDDAEMNAAIATARKTLPRFDAALNSGNPDQYGFALKVRFGAADAGEHIWLSDIVIDSNQYYGVVNNDPEYITEVAMGDTVRIDKTAISDWMFLEKGVLRGGSTIRYVRDHMTPAERATFDKEQGIIFED